MNTLVFQAEAAGEELRYCPKLRAGGMEYALSKAGRYVRLVSDRPSAGGNGSWYDSKTKIPFDAINNVLSTMGTVQTRDFAHLFEVNTSNNGPMLVAALLHEGLLTKGRNGCFHVGIRRL